MIPVAFTENLSHEEWLHMRKSGIGGSDISAIVGENPWSSPLQVYSQKLSLIPPIDETDNMLFGKLLEPIVANVFSERTGLAVKELKFVLRHEKYPHLLANVDRIIEHPEWGRGILECKTANAYKLSDWEHGRIPKHYFYQVQHYLGVTGYSYAYIACLVGGNTFRYSRIERDEALITWLQESATYFWQHHVLPETPPSAMHNDGKALSAMYPNHEDEIYHMYDDEYPLLEELLLARRYVKEADQMKLRAENKIKERMAFNESLYYNGEKLISWKTNKKQVRVFNVLCDEGE